MRKRFFDEHGADCNEDLAAKVRATMQHIAGLALAEVRQCPSYFAFGPIYELVANEVTAATSDWQPIETAPRDMTFVLLWAAGSRVTEGYFDP